MDTNRYRYITSAVVGVIVLAVVISQTAINSRIAAESPARMLLTGPVWLTAQDTTLRITIKANTDSIELSLINKIPACFNAAKPVNYTVQCAPSMDWITITAPPGQSLANQSIFVGISNPNQSGFPPRVFINKVRLSRTEQNLTQFYGLIDLNTTNLKLYYAFSVLNISSFLAQFIGYHLVWLTTTVLLILLLSQLLLIVVSWWQPSSVKKYFKSETGQTAIAKIDELATQFAIPLGFLGTVLSVWYSLETAQTDFGSFFKVLELMRIAVFTTIMGLAIKIICVIRGYLGATED